MSEPFHTKYEKAIASPLKVCSSTHTDPESRVIVRFSCCGELIGVIKSELLTTPSLWRFSCGRYGGSYSSSLSVIIDFSSSSTTE